MICLENRTFTTITKGLTSKLFHTIYINSIPIPLNAQNAHNKIERERARAPINICSSQQVKTKINWQTSKQCDIGDTYLYLAINYGQNGIVF